jgi:hypothetical protein
MCVLWWLVQAETRSTQHVKMFVNNYSCGGRTAFYSSGIPYLNVLSASLKKL